MKKIKLNRKGRVWKLVSLALIAVPWLLRDQLAASMDKATAAAQEIQTGLESGKRQEQKDRDQRLQSETMQHIETMVEKLSQKNAAPEEGVTSAEDSTAVLAYLKEHEPDQWEKSTGGDAQELIDMAATFKTQLETFKDFASPVALAPQQDGSPDSEDVEAVRAMLGAPEKTPIILTKEKLEELADSVSAKADSAKNRSERFADLLSEKTEQESKLNPKANLDELIDTTNDAIQNEIDNDITTAQLAINQAYSTLDDVAESEKNSSSDWASRFRVIAWIFTGLGGLLFYGDTSKLLGGPDGDGTETDET